MQDGIAAGIVALPGDAFRQRQRVAQSQVEALRAQGVQALRRIAEAFGVKDVAEAAHLNPKTIYRTLSPSGNPELKSFQAILGAMGMRLAVTSLHQNHEFQ